MAKSPDCKIQSACQTQRLNKRRDCQQIRLLPGIQVGSGIPERAASSGIKRSCCKIQRMHKIWRMPMSFKTIFCISQLFYNGPSIVNLHAPMSERTTMNESSQAHLASLNLNRLRRCTFIVNLHAPTGEHATMNESCLAHWAYLNLCRLTAARLS